MLHLLRKVCARKSSADDSVNEQRILKHALDSFATQGYAASGLRAIAKDADVTAPMVNYYFKTKESLYQRVGAMVLDAVASTIAEAWPTEGGLEDILRTNLEAHLRFTAEFPEAIAFLFGLLYGPSGGAPLIDFSKYEEVEERVRKAFERATRTGELALLEGVTRQDAVELYQAFVLSMVSHAFKARRFGKPALDPRAAVRRLGMVLAGIGTLRVEAKRSVAR
ncbi:MAG: transcriptional regulator, TetR family protein [Myxococcales bacterium]|nr:transcriptional regulator, TetR family protein [Myxococcales bacterium]